ncbi:MAG: ABC transporter ATP-binding protein [Phycicoccus sp.]|nr:ABC transporter ATP-binding protein [Phycicoccus sp.]
MSDRILSDEEKAAADRRGPAGGAQRSGPPHMRMGQPGEKASAFLPSAKRLLGLLSPDKAIVWVAMVFALSSVVLSALGPRILGQATDLIFSGIFSKQIPSGVTQEQAVEGMRAAGEGKLADMLAAMDHVRPGLGIDFPAVRNILLLALGLYAVASLLQWVQARVIVRVVNAAVYRLRRDVESKLGRLPLSYFDTQPRGELLSRVTNDIDNIAQSLQQTLSQLLTSLLTVVAMLTMMIWVSPLLAVIAIVTIPVSIGITAVIGKRSQRHFVQQWASTGQVNSIVEETFSGHALVKVFGRKQEVERTFATVNDELRNASFGAQFVSGLIMPMMMFVGNLNYVAIAVVGGLRVASGSMSIGDVQAFIQYSRQFTQPLTQVASMANLMQSGVASAERVFAVLDEPEQTPDPADPVTLVDPHGRVSFEDVSFSYNPKTPLVEHLDLCVEPGQTVAIVGPTGAGKTTLVNLIMRFYEVSGGRITLDGVDITAMTRDSLRGHIGMVLQDTWLFSGTIRENIAYGRPDATEDEILEAARATYVDRFVHSLPDGYDTVLDSEAGNISAGEKQLVTIARAFLARPALLILDEATSSVDTRTELLLQHAMGALREDRTSFVIAHRLSTIRDADLILVMEDGRIVEQGTHAELLSARGAFARLYAAQFAGAIELDGESGNPVGALAGAPAGAAGAEPGLPG